MIREPGSLGAGYVDTVAYSSREKMKIHSLPCLFLSPPLLVPPPKKKSPLMDHRAVGVRISRVYHELNSCIV